MAGDHHTRSDDIAVASLVLYAADLEATEAFYRALGLDLHQEQHGDGPVHSVTRLGGDVHFALHQADPTEPSANPAWQQAGSSFPGVWVADLDATAEALRGDDHLILLEHEVRSWGCRTVAEDPDGRAIEINQRGHCDT
ncbi:MAG: VOC family protein [Iamia sp.]